MITQKNLGTDTTAPDEYHLRAPLSDSVRYSAPALPLEAEIDASKVAPAFDAEIEQLPKLDSQSK